MLTHNLTIEKMRATFVFNRLIDLDKSEDEEDVDTEGPLTNLLNLGEVKMNTKIKVVVPARVANMVSTVEDEV